MISNVLIKKIVTAMGIKKQDIVLLQFWGENKDRDTLNAFSYDVAKVGATPIEFQHSREYYKNLFESFPNDYSIPEEYFNVFKDFNVIIDLFTYKPVVPHTDFPSEKLNLYKEFMAKLFSIVSSKEKFIQLRLPTEENSMESNLDYETFKNSLLNAYDIDYEALNNNCDDLIESLSEKNSIIIETLPPKGNILCEFGIRLNKNIKDIVGYTVLYEKAYGTYHIAIGMNSMFGGKNESPFHMDFVFKGDVTYI